MQQLGGVLQNSFTLITVLPCRDHVTVLQTKNIQEKFYKQEEVIVIQGKKKKTDNTWWVKIDKKLWIFFFRSVKWRWRNAQVINQHISQFKKAQKDMAVEPLFLSHCLGDYSDMFWKKNEL